MEEFGYSYIVDILNLQEEQLRTFLGFLNYIHINKGTRRGLEFVFRILDMDCVITEWWEAIPNKDPLTYEINLLSFSPNNIRGFEVIDKILTFSRNYVYPIMEKLTVEFKLDHAVVGAYGVFQSTADYVLHPDGYTPYIFPCKENVFGAFKSTNNYTLYPDI